MRRTHAMAAGVVLLVAGTAAGAHAAQAPPKAADTPAQWCTKQGGEPRTFIPFATGTGDKMLPLGGHREMCVFTADDEAKSRIMISADSLAADQPTLAALAYVHPPKDPGGHPGNPSIGYCSAVGGTAMFGNKPTDGGGWADKNETDPSKAIGGCMFADGSVIDPWGLKYKEAGVIRGADLTKKFKVEIPGA